MRRWTRITLHPPRGRTCGFGVGDEGWCEKPAVAGVIEQGMTFEKVPAFHPRGTELTTWPRYVTAACNEHCIEYVGIDLGEPVIAL